MRDGDALIVWRLDRQGRSLPYLIEVISGLESRGVGFRSLTESIDTATSGGRLIFHVFGALGLFDRDPTRERAKAGGRCTAQGQQDCPLRCLAIQQCSRLVIFGVIVF